MRYVTSVLDLVGSLLLVAAVVVAVWPWSIAAALASGGAALLALSWLIDKPWKSKRKRKVVGS